MSFGRKGLVPTVRREIVAAPRTIGMNTMAARASTAEDDIARKREAFIASERARSGKVEASEPGLSAVAQAYDDSRRPVRSLRMAYVLWAVLGLTSAHRFYLGSLRSAGIQVGLYAIGFFSVLGGTLGTGKWAEYLSSFGLGVIGLWLLWVIGDGLLIRWLHGRLCRPSA